MIPFKQTAVLIFLALLSFGATCQQAPLRLWFDRPARQWEESLPLGNGRLGMMPDGNVFNENIVLNEITMWSGSQQDANNYDAYKNLPAIRALLLEGKNNEAQALVNKTFVCKGPGSGRGNGANVQFGCYQVLGNLHLQFDYAGVDSNAATPSSYHRELSLDNALSTCTYKLNGIGYTREYFTSFTDDVSIIRLTSDKKQQINCTITLDRPERFSVAAAGNELQMSGQLNNGTDGKGMRYQARLQSRSSDGKISVKGNKMVIKDATDVTIYISAATDFRGDQFEQKNSQLLGAALKKSYASQKQAHVARYRKLFGRLKLSLGKADLDSMPTDRRLVAFSSSRWQITI